MSSQGGNAVIEESGMITGSVKRKPEEHLNRMLKVKGLLAHGSKNRRSLRHRGNDAPKKEDSSGTKAGISKTAILQPFKKQMRCLD